MILHRELHTEINEWLNSFCDIQLLAPFQSGYKLNILRIPWTEELGKLWSIGSQRVEAI